MHLTESRIKKKNNILTFFFFLGTFQKVEHVFVCGAGGGVPHYTDYDKHVKLGDVVVSHYGNDQKYCIKSVYLLYNVV